MSSQPLYSIETIASRTAFEHASKNLFRDVDLSLWVSRICGPRYIPRPFLTLRYFQESLHPGIGQSGVSHLQRITLT